MSMQEANWNNFKAKFNGKEQKSFEWLCYLLFCKEFKKNTGIFRYKNQVGIETEPIEHNGQIIGPQAKFYETKISENKGDIKDSIETAKRKNGNLNKIIFYINQEFSESSKKGKKDPAYKIEIKNHAKSLGVEIDWRSRSFFDSPFVSQDNAVIAQHFFSLGKSVIDFLNELTRHTEATLAAINSKIIFRNNEIKIDTAQNIKVLQEVLVTSPMAILSGGAGVGKTALIKDFYDSIKDRTPFYIFKGVEFCVSNINQLFANYGSFTLLDFVKEHQDFEEKYIIIDSAEKLSDIEYKEVFQEFLSTMQINKWRVIFTTRYSYLDDLRFQFIEIYRVRCQPVNIEDLTTSQLNEVSRKYGFDLPKNDRLFELLRIPFYLNEYLQNYDSLGNAISFSNFKNLLWNKQISKTSYQKDNTHIKREKCFLEIAHKRAVEGSFFVKADGCEDEVLRALENDEIIKYNSNAGGYFITHDIYEEWALGNIIERIFLNSKNNKDFLKEIGSSLPIRRAFRNWLSEKLFNNGNEVKAFIESTIIDDTIESYWKDEIYVSILLSDYAEAFFKVFKDKLLENNQAFLVKIVFLLRIGCKEIDEDLLSIFDIQRTAWSALKTIFTKPKGHGWKSTINFIYENKDKVVLQRMNIILPLLDDWNNKNKGGETTKQASLIALYYYNEITKERYYHISDRKEGQLTRVILQGSSGIKNELKSIFNEVISNKAVKHRDRYYALIKPILTSLTDSFEVIKALPNYVIKLADIFWFYNPDDLDDDYRYSRRMGMEDYFCISSMHNDFFPASAFQTPIYQLLRIVPQETVDFILSFTNKTVECYVKSELDGKIDQVDVFVDKNKVIKQYISNRLWCMYRGTQVAPHLLESMHMALEKWLLEVAKSASKEVIESWCHYLIKNSKSVSITAVVSSIVLAQPSKLFNIAKILFQTKELFLCDTSRLLMDEQAKSQYSIGYELNYDFQIYQDERIKTCDDSHRKCSLEHLALKYQLFRTEEGTEDEVKERQKTIWDIFDKYYAELPDKSSETDFDKTWKLYLARMDRRKMRPEVEKTDEGTLIKFNSEIDPDLKKHSENTQQRISEKMKYAGLRVWADSRFRGGKETYEKYPQYESNPKKVIAEAKEIFEGLKTKKEEEYSLFNRSVPAYACSVLMRDFFDNLDSDEREFCKEVIIGYAAMPLMAEKYMYQISDGTEPTIALLPNLMEHFKKDKKDIKRLLFRLLFIPSREMSTFAAKGILNKLWKISFNDANSIFLGYLLLSPKYYALIDEIREKNYKRKYYGDLRAQVSKAFQKKYKKELERVVNNHVSYDELDSLESMNLEILKSAFEILPIETTSKDHKKFLSVIFPIFAKKILQDDHEDRIDYNLRHRFLEKLAYFILNIPKKEIKAYLQPFIDNFQNSREMSEFFQEFIYVEDKLSKYNEFWTVWNAFYGKVSDLCKNKSGYYAKEVISSYLLAGISWNEKAKEWHTIKEREKIFFKKVSEEMGQHPIVLYSISKVLNDIGSNFIEDGLTWISYIVEDNKQLISEELDTNTVFYIENFIRRYILKYHPKIKKSMSTKKQVIVVLNYLVERGSIVGYLLRDDIL
jgi:hypothetical protein